MNKRMALGGADRPGSAANDAHANDEYTTVAAAIRFLDTQVEAQPSLEEVAAGIGLSAGHFQRLFSRWAGVSPKRFLQALTLARARVLLRDSRPVIDAAFAAGLSGSGRLHDLCVECEATTPGEVAALGAGLTLRHGFAATPFGNALLALSPRGLCHLAFVDDDGAALAELRAEWPAARLIADHPLARRTAARVFARVGGKPLQPLSLWLKGTNFQYRVWQALLRLPTGSVVSYGNLAARIGREGAARAVGSAVAQNPVAWLIPCHRVIRETGALGGYRWGVERKHLLLVREAAERWARDSGEAGGLGAALVQNP